MAILQRDFVKVENDFTIIPNEVLRNKEIKSSTKNILLTMFSLPPDWDFSIAGISKVVYEGKETVQKALVELEKIGYITRKRERKEGGTFGAMIYTIHQFPVSEDKNTYKKNFSDNQDVKNQKQVFPKQETETQYNIDNKLNIDINKANTSSNDNVKADTAFPKKSLNAPKQKKTRSELIELEKDMYMRFGLIGREYDVSETAFKNIIRAFSRYLIRHRQQTGKAHPILKDETLEKIFLTLASIQDFKYNHFDNIADYEPEDGELSYLEQMVDEHFGSKHKKDTDWHISHFVVPEYLEKIAQHVTGY